MAAAHGISVKDVPRIASDEMQVFSTSGVVSHTHGIIGTVEVEFFDEPSIRRSESDLLLAYP
jgi:hypothetical protein